MFDSSTFTLPEIAGSAAFCLLVLDRALIFAMKIKNGKDHPTNGMAGEKSTDFWRKDFRDAVREVMDQQGWGESLKEIANGVNRLVVFEEQRQREGR